jgi:hypothetical protein
MGKAIDQRVGHRIFIQRAEVFIASRAKRVLLATIVAAAVFAASPEKARSVQLAQDAQDLPDAAQSAPLTPEALQRLVAPIALYPDELVAQILAASTYPSEIVEADRWLQNQPNPTDEKVAVEVDKQSWDPSVKALTDFPSVLSNLDTNLSWTSSLGDAYFNQQQDVLDAVQVLRARAKDAGNLQSSPQQTVMDQGSTIIIQPADPDVCYVPTYNPLLVYGDPIGTYPGYLYDSLIGAPYLSFGAGIGIGGGRRRGFGWGFDSWDFDWTGRSVIFNHNTYVSHSPTFFHRFPGSGGGNFGRGPGGPSFTGNGTSEINRNRGAGFPGGNFDRNRIQGIPNTNSDGNRGGGLAGGNFDRNRNQGIANPNLGRSLGGAGLTPEPQSRHDYRGFSQPGPSTGTRSGAFSGFGQGGIERGSASRGQSSLGGLGGFGGGRGVGGGAGMRGGGGGHGGGRH